MNLHLDQDRGEGSCHSLSCFLLRTPGKLRLGGPLMLMCDFPFTFAMKEFNGAL